MPTVYKLDEWLVCRCKHTWDVHHHGVVLNPEYNDYPLNINGCIAEECEYNQFEGYFVPKDKEKAMCRCNNFVPRSFNVLKLVNEWRKKHGQAV